MFRKYASFLSLLTAFAFATACSKDDPATPVTSTAVAVTATLNGAQQVPSNSSAATGTLTGSYNPSSRVLTYSITYQGLAAGITSGHFHQGTPGVSGSVIVALSQIASSPITGTATFSQADGDKLLANGVYVNLHTAAFPNGEIRGNLLADNPNVVNLTAEINGYDQVPANNSTAAGVLNGTFDKTSRVLTYSITYFGIPAGITSGHFHQGAPGVSGSVIVALSQVATSPITGTATFSQADADKLLANGVYVNLHTTAFPNGEIRGNIKPGTTPVLAPPVNVSAVLDGTQHTPMINSAATGTMTGVYNPNTRVLNYTVTYQGFPAGAGPTAGHIHQGLPGVNGPVVVPFAQVATSPITGTATLTQADGDKLTTNAMYVNLHTVANPNGEIRGNITVDNPDVIRVAAAINSADQVPANTSTASGTMTGTFTKSTRQLAYTILYQGFAAGSGPVAGHFHQAAPGMNGSVFQTLPQVATSPITGTATLSAADAAKLQTNEVYVNLHTAAYPNGEIRGNIRVQ